MALANHLRNRKQRHQGSSLPEVLVSSAILASTVLATLQISNSTIAGMGQSKVRAQIDSAIAERMEKLRGHAFRYLCRTGTDSLHPTPGGCSDNSLSYELAYGEHDHDDPANHLANLKAMCASGLGQGLLDAIETNEPALLDAFSIEGSQPSVTITPSTSVDGNRLRVSFSASPVNTEVTTTLVPTAQGWCP